MNKLPIKPRSEFAMQTRTMAPVGRLPTGEFVMQDDLDPPDYCQILKPDELRAIALRMLAALDDGAHVELWPVMHIGHTAPLAEPERILSDGRIVLETDEYATPLTPAELEQYIARLARALAIARERDGH